MDGVWQSWNRPVGAYDEPTLQVACYQHAGRTPDISDARAVYRALSKTPFPSLYATASAHEYVAELAAWSVLSSRLHQPYTMTVYLKGKVSLVFQPEAGELVKRESSKTRYDSRPEGVQDH